MPTNTAVVVRKHVGGSGVGSGLNFQSRDTTRRGLTGGPSMQEGRDNTCGYFPSGVATSGVSAVGVLLVFKHPPSILRARTL